MALRNAETQTTWLGKIWQRTGDFLKNIGNRVYDFLSVEVANDNNQTPLLLKNEVPEHFIEELKYKNPELYAFITGKKAYRYFEDDDLAIAVRQSTKREALETIADHTYWLFHEYTWADYSRTPLAVKILKVQKTDSSQQIIYVENNWKKVILNKQWIYRSNSKGKFHNLAISKLAGIRLDQQCSGYYIQTGTHKFEIGAYYSMIINQSRKTGTVLWYGKQGWILVQSYGKIYEVPAQNVGHPTNRWHETENRKQAADNSGQATGERWQNSERRDWLHHSKTSNVEQKTDDMQQTAGGRQQEREGRQQKTESRLQEAVDRRQEAERTVEKQPAAIIKLQELVQEIWRIYQNIKHVLEWYERHILQNHQNSSTLLQTIRSSQELGKNFATLRNQLFFKTGDIQEYQAVESAVSRMRPWSPRKKKLDETLTIRKSNLLQKGGKLHNFVNWPQRDKIESFVSQSRANLGRFSIVFQDNIWLNWQLEQLKAKYSTFNEQVQKVTTDPALFKDLQTVYKNFQWLWLDSIQGVQGKIEQFQRSQWIYNKARQSLDFIEETSVIWRDQLQQLRDALKAWSKKAA